MKTKAPPEPPRLKCENCGGKKWFPSSIGEIACERCGGSGKGKIDVATLIKEWQELKMHRCASFLDEALNSGDGTYKP